MVVAKRSGGECGYRAHAFSVGQQGFIRIVNGGDGMFLGETLSSRTVSGRDRDHFYARDPSSGLD